MKNPIQRFPNDIQAWWQKTQDDIRWARHTFDAGFFTQVCFLTQQIVEKALKTFLLSQNVIVEKTHKLPLLVRQAARFDRRFETFKPHAKILDRYYISTRYPPFGGPKGEYTKEEANHALTLSQEIVEFVQIKLSPNEK